MLRLLIISLIRGKIASASNNGTKCAAARTIPLSETNACNDVPCPGKSQHILKFLNFAKKKKKLIFCGFGIWVAVFDKKVLY